jgi:autotransporter-associated beta strand protein
VSRAHALGAERWHAAGIVGRILLRAGRWLVWPAPLAGAALIVAALPALAQDATWLANPGSNLYNAFANWTPATVPTGTAFFGASNTTSLSFEDDATVGGWTFNAGAPAYTFNNSHHLLFDGAGIVSDGGSVAIITNSGGTTTFSNASTAGNATVTTNNGGGVFFADTSSGGQASFTTNAGGVFDISQLTSGGTTAGSIAGGGNYFLGANALTVGSNNLSTTVSGVISDGGVGGGAGGALVKVGSGTLTLSGANTYTGTTTVNAGTLEVDGSIAPSSLLSVNNGGTLIGTGTVGNTQINSGAVFAPGAAGTPGTAMTVAGNLAFQSGAIYLTQVNPTTASLVNVTGTATLAGSVLATFAPGTYLRNQYTILTSAGLGGTTFSGLATTNLPSFFTASLSYNAADTDVFLNLSMASLLAQLPRLPTNQQNVANALTFFFNSGGSLPPSLANLFFFDTAEQKFVALSQLTGEAGTGAVKVTFNSQTGFLTLIFQNQEQPQISSLTGFAPEQQTSFPPDIALAYASVLKAPPPQTSDPHWSAWGSTFGGSNTTNGDPVVGSSTVTAHAYGYAAGMDYQASPDMALGFALAGGGTNWGLALGLGGGRSDEFQAGVHGTARLGPAYVSAALAFANDWFTTNRIAIGDQLTASFVGQSYAARTEAGYRYGMPVNNAIGIVGMTPYAALQAQLFHTPSYSETDLTGGGLGLNYNAMTATDTRSELGARFDNLQIVNHMPLVLRARAAWAHDWLSNLALTPVFQALPGASFIVNGATPPKDSALATAEAELRVTANWSLLAKFDGEFAAGSQTYAGTGTVRYTW